MIKKNLIVFVLFFTALQVMAIEPTESLPIPSEVQFASQTISLDRYDMRERYDREQIAITFQHSLSLLIIKRANRYFPIIEPILKANGIPDDFKYLAVIESNLDLRALSPVQAAGLWQLMPKTAEQFGLEVNNEVDERYHVAKATEAACKYLKSAFNKYKSWTSAAISYNAGMGKISSELTKQQVEDALDMLLTSESSRYFFRILAMKQFLENPAHFGYKIHKNDFYQNINTQPVLITDSVGDWTIWAAKYGISYAQLKDFNIWLRDRKLTNLKKRSYIIDVPVKEDLSFKTAKIKIHPTLFNDKFF